MSDHIYRIIELVGSSEIGIEDAMHGAVARAAETIRHLRWIEVGQIRGHIEHGKIAHFQVTLKAAFTIEDEIAPLE